MSELASRLTAEHYSWGDGCDGWRLLINKEFNVIEELMPPGTAELWHYHRRARQFFYVLSGQLLITTNSGTQAISAMSGLEIAPTVPHRVQNCVREPARFLVISVPPTSADRFNIDPPME